MLMVHATAGDFRPRGDGPCAPGRDSAQPRCPIRSSVARGLAGGTWLELSRGGQAIGRCAADHRELGPSLRTGRLRRLGRWRTRRATDAIESKAKSAGRGGTAAPSCRLRSSSSVVGRPVIIVVSKETVRGDAARPTVPETFSTIGFSAAHASARSRPSRSGRTSGGKKNSGCWQQIPPSTCGRWMKFTFSSTAADAACGFRPKSEIPCVSMLRCGKVSAISGRFACETVSCALCRRPAISMPRLVGSFCVTSSESAHGPAGVWSSSLTTPNTTTPRSMLPGVWRSNPTSRCSSFLLTAPSSTPSSGFGSWFDASGSTTTTSLPSPSSPSSWMLSSKLGIVQTTSSIDSVRSRTMRINLGRCV